MELIPAIDLKDGRCVRLLKGDFSAETVYSNDPAEILARYRGFGARRVHVVDLDGAKDGTQANRDVIMKFASDPSVKLQVGGGLRSLDRVKALLEAGVERAVIGSVAINSPEVVVSWLSEVDPTRVVLALDVRLDDSGLPMLTTHGWQQTSGVLLWTAVERFVRVGLSHVLCTDVARDGALTGPNFELYAEAVRRFPELQWQASGGVATARDLIALRDCGVAAVISGKALLENKISSQELRPFLPNASSPVSM
ncbi:1-(5-phosphoribosyl)-5-[(5-phosphoribosylamino)methylideneamino]imidazole-4-carboxamide isomerase [Steroidobacter sp. S1-65]|uniref:1-(5-phosphoribosyl)-5-[(5-phosphoribosylamino)methylideneamino] imidazole-4-carboxamide isomerase n=1 Tax=Steroidobacter gossypii TaxID=2805490 RepID=A0ABS1WXK3_9GAMM|nr:1-(5-phosphoribosyl)-5-[(5-phosphoribosylamino)methylideneamino]imidazole-4-carboxamide isomerase [Steroidobacter gossypii]MBM0105705.1 1-(5-phosphoribosyl)-5-[(5-phosphoribosylamino)methylideneamino]imidazole-4-carboxamide isomerase [Steroidobacter gossypii]